MFFKYYYSAQFLYKAWKRFRKYGAALTAEMTGESFAFSALPYTPHELENARHLYELPRDDNKTIVRCAAFQRGVGGDNSWGAKPHADDCFAVEKGMTFAFTIQKQG